MIPAEFFAAVRPIFGGRLSQEQVDGITAILEAGKRYGLHKRQLAYLLATAKHESGHTMQPVQENLRYSAKRIREVWPRVSAAKARRLERNPEALANYVYANKLGNGDEASGDGWRYSGKGLVQPTGKGNYRKGGDLIGVDLEAHPERALEMDVAVRLLIEGTMEGIWTGQKLAGYVNEMKRDYLNARRSVSSMFEAQKLVPVAEAFEAALAHVDVPPVPKPRPVVDHGPAVNEARPPSPSKGEPQGWLAIIIALLKRIFGKG